MPRRHSTPDKPPTRKRRMGGARPATVGGFSLDDIPGVSAVAHVATSAWDAAKHNVPGVQEISDSVDAMVDGPVKDFARTGVGKTMFQALAGAVTAGLAPILGPQLATVAFAIPGMAAGDDFVTAYTQEFSERVKKTAEILGTDAAGEALGSQMQKAGEYLAEHPELDPSTIVDFKALAKTIGVREDVAAMIVQWAKGHLLSELPDWDFDAASGAAKKKTPNIFSAVRRSLFISPEVERQQKIRDAIFRSKASARTTSNFQLSDEEQSREAQVRAELASLDTAERPSGELANSSSMFTKKAIAIALVAIGVLYLSLRRS